LAYVIALKEEWKSKKSLKNQIKFLPPEMLILFLFSQ
jgi:hypothetical protein